MQQHVYCLSYVSFVFLVQSGSVKNQTGQGTRHQHKGNITYELYLLPEDRQLRPKHVGGILKIGFNQSDCF